MTYVPEGLTARRRFIARGNSRTSRARLRLRARFPARRADNRRRGPDDSLEKPSRFIAGIGSLSSWTRLRPEIGEKPSIGRACRCRRRPSLRKPGHRYDPIVVRGVKKERINLNYSQLRTTSGASVAAIISRDYGKRDCLLGVAFNTRFWNRACYNGSARSIVGSLLGRSLLEDSWKLNKKIVYRFASVTVTISSSLWSISN